MASTSNVVNLNTYTSKRVVVTNAAAPAVSTSQVFYPIFSNSTTTGSQDLRNTDRVYLWEDSTSSYFNVGNDSTNGGLTLHNSASYVNIVPTTLTTTRTLTIPNLSGTICLTEGMPSLSIGQRETTTDPSTLTYSDRISIIPYFHIGGPWKIKSADDATNAHLALFYGNTELLRIRHDGTQLIDWSGNAATATQLETAGTTAQFYRGDRTWSSTISGGTLTCIPGTSTDATQMAFNGGIQVREAGGVGSAQSTLVYAPRISFHWSNRIAKSISLHSDGIFYFRNQNGTDRSSIDANLVGNASTSSGVLDIGNTSKTTTFAYSKAGLAYADYTWLAAWNGYELRAVNKNQFATASHNHNRAGVSRSWINGRDTAIIRTTSYSGYDAILSMKTTNGAWELGVYTNNILYFVYTPDDKYSAGSNTGYNNTVNIRPSGVIYGACWNDYAECRQVKTNEPGYCVTETSSGTMIKTTKRLQAGCKITSDTFGLCIGETDYAKTPIAVSGRALVYPYRAREEYELGAAVCSAPDGKVDIMTRDEIMMYPERIVGTVSEIPAYEIWSGGGRNGQNEIEVKGRIWIYIR